MLKELKTRDQQQQQANNLKPLGSTLLRDRKV